jgi:bacteriorhodopsin
MVVLGIILLVVGWLTGVSIVSTIGIVLIVLGVILFALGASGRAVGGRSHWY